MPPKSIEAVEVAIRAWLLSFALLAVWNAMFSTPILLEHWARPIPWLLASLAAMIWAVCMLDLRVVRVCTVVLVIGFFMRAIEWVGFSDAAVSQRLSGAGYWVFIAMTSLVFGFLNITVVVTRQVRER